MKKALWIQFAVLLAGTLFAWVNFSLELADWFEETSCQSVCAANSANPFFTPCFYGAIFFTLAFILNIAIIRLAVKEKR